MSLKKRVYSVLIVSAAQSFYTALSDLMPETRYSPVHTVTSVSAAKRAFTNRSYDFLIINSPLPDEAGTKYAIDACGFPDTVVLLMVRNALHAEINDKVSEYGVFTLPKPTSKASILTALSWMASARERLQKMEKKTLSIEEKMQEIRIVNRAKWLLIRELSMDEPEAHRYIEKQAMDRCIPKREVAEEIIQTYS